MWWQMWWRQQPNPVFMCNLISSHQSWCWWERGKKIKLRDCVLFFKVMYFYICWPVCVGGQVWILVCLLMQCQREVQVGVVPGPAHILHPHSPMNSFTHQSGKTLSSWHRWCRCQGSWWHQMTVTLPWGNHQCLAHVLCTSGLPPKINSSLWCSSSTQIIYNPPFLLQVLWGRTDGKKNKRMIL